jgi:hypothetical protein
MEPVASVFKRFRADLYWTGLKEIRTTAIGSTRLERFIDEIKAKLKLVEQNGFIKMVSFVWFKII